MYMEALTDMKQEKSRNFFSVFLSRFGEFLQTTFDLFLLQFSCSNAIIFLPDLHQGDLAKLTLQ